MNEKREEHRLILTEDGSHSIYVPGLNETYHSFHGAIQESGYVFIKRGLEYFAGNQNRSLIKVLEVGLGTGLNALLTAQWAEEMQKKVEMTSLEAYPVPKGLVDVLNYPGKISSKHAPGWFRKIHHSLWDEAVEIHDLFVLNKVMAKLETYPLPFQEFDVVFFDAFAPNKQAELWDLSVLDKVYQSQNYPSVFVTYCAKGQLKRDLRSLGYQVETLPGPPGKKEMVRAIKPGKIESKH